MLGSAFSNEKLNFLYKDQLGLTASAVATLALLTALPTYVQPFGGSLSELVPLWGYHRRSYYALAALVETAGLLPLALMPSYHYAVTALAVIVTGAGGVMLYVVAQAVMVEIGNATGQIGRLQTVPMFVAPILTIAFAAHLSGYVTQHWSYHACFAASALATLPTLPLTLLIHEKRLPKPTQETPEENAARRAARQADRAQTVAALREVVRSPAIRCVIGFIFYLQLVPEVGTAQFFFQVDYLHLSKQTIGDLNGWGSAGALAGVLIFAAVSPRLPLRVITWGAALFGGLFYLPLVFMHDTASAKAASLVCGVFNSWYGLCMAVLAARVCLRRIEGTVYALYGAASAMGYQIGNKTGSLLYDHFGANHQIAHGWHAMLWVAMGTTALAAVFIPFMPAWARSRKNLKALAEDEPQAADRVSAEPATP